MGHKITLSEIQSFQGRYPKQLWYLFFSEMWERFCFYGMRGMLTFFMVDQLLMKDDVANLQYGATQAFVYAFTFIGGLFADKILGFRRSLFWGGLLMIAGSLILALDPHQFFFLGISFTVVGTGFFKPNISTMVGSLYKKDDNRRDAGFSVFYAGINIGALLGGYICVAIGKGQMLSAIIPATATWNIAFGLAAIVMTISLLTFLFTQKLMGPIGLPPENSSSTTAVLTEGVNDKLPSEVVSIKQANNGKPWHSYLVYIGSLAAIPLIMVMVSKTDYTDYFMCTIGPIALLYLIYEMFKYKKSERKKLLAALVFIIFSIIFWGIFEQSGGSLSLFAARNLDNKLIGTFILDPNGVNNAANALFVVVFAFVLSLVWIFLAKHKKEPNTIIKFGLAFIFLALAYFTFFSTKFFLNDKGLASLDIFTFAYLVVTFAELCLSPIGLSIMTKLSPAKLQGLMMGMWFLASAYGQYVAGLLGASLSRGGENETPLQQLFSYTAGYKQLAIYALVAGIVLIVISPWVKKLMQEVR
jgi:POT family proton-dependent oligopeptide transporter